MLLHWALIAVLAAATAAEMRVAAPPAWVFQISSLQKWRKTQFHCQVKSKDCGIIGEAAVISSLNYILQR